MLVLQNLEPESTQKDIEKQVVIILGEVIISGDDY